MNITSSADSFCLNFYPFQRIDKTMSNVFNDSPIREAPTGRRRELLNRKYDCISECLDAILEKAEKGMAEIRLAIEEAKAAAEERRYLVLRNNTKEDDLDINIINDNGDFRLVCFTDASSQQQTNGPLFRYGLGIYLGFENPDNRALAAPLTCSSMMEAEILAVLEGLKAISSLENRIGRRVANKIAIYIDNLEGQRLIASIMAEPMGSALLESMSMNSPRVRHYVRTIREEADKYQSVTFLWTRAHTRSNSYIAQGNAKADKLAKDGLCIALSDD